MRVARSIAALGTCGEKRSHKPKNPYNAALGRKFCVALSESDRSVTALLKAMPELPSILTLYRWRDQNPAFATLWRRAREAQAEHLMQQCLDLAKNATPESAHVARVRFDIYRFFGRAILPNIYGDKPAQGSSHNVSVNVVVSPERLNAIRTKLDASRQAFALTARRKERPSRLPKSLLLFDQQKSEHKLPQPLGNGVPTAGESSASTK